jgi:hypothetical protein
VRAALERVLASPDPEVSVCESLATALGHLRPELDRCLLTDESLPAAAAHTAQLFTRVFAASRTPTSCT